MEKVHLEKLLASTNAEKNELMAQRDALREACQFTLTTLDGMTTQEFAHGGDKAARKKLETALA